MVRLPGFDLVHDGISHRRHQSGRNLGSVHFQPVSLNLAHRHAAGGQRQHLVVKAAPVCLVLTKQLGLKSARAVARDFNR